MTVGELIQALERYQPTSPVFVDGYEGGFTDPKLREAKVVRRRASGWWEGEWTNDKDGVPSVVVGR